MTETKKAFYVDEPESQKSESFGLRRSISLPFWALLVGLLMATSGIVSAAAVTRGAVGYMQVFVALPTPILIIGSLLILGAIAAWGITESLTVAAAFTVMEIGGLMLIIWVGRDAFTATNFHISEFIPSTDTVRGDDPIS